MAFTLIWTPNSLAVLEQIVRNIASDRPNAAERFRFHAHEMVDRLIDMPLLGSVLDSRKTPQLRELLCDPYRIIYRVNEVRKTVHIVTLWHSSRDEPTRADLLA